MSSFRRVAVCLAALGLAAGASRAAVSTSTVRVTSGVPPYSISYILAQDISGGAGTMTVNIRKASDNAIVRTFTVTDDLALLKGAHTNEVTWDGKTTAGAQAPNGTYYAEIVTTGSAVTQMTLLGGPSQTKDATGTAIDGRNDYGGDTNRNPTSPYHNLYYLATRASNASARTGVWVANVDTSHNTFFNPTGATVATDWVSAAILPDDNIVLTGRSSGNVIVVQPDTGAVAATYGAGRVKTRTAVAFGTTAHPELFYADEGSTGGGGTGSIDYIADLSAYTSTSTPVVLVPVGDLPSSARVIVVNKAKTSFWVSGQLATTGEVGPAYAWIRKYNLTRDAGNNITGATLDASFTYNDPYTFTPSINYPTAANQRGLALSPDESVLWFTINEGTRAFDYGNSLVIGYNAATGAFLGANHLYVAQFNTEELSVTSSGNLFVSTYPGIITGSTARTIYTLAPPDNGSTDTARSFDFIVTSSTNNTITSGPTVTDITYHSGTINWTTQFPANATVEYGTTNAYGSTITVPGEPDVNNSVKLDALAAGTIYYYKVTSSVSGLNDATATGQFTTNPLTLTNVQVPPALLSSGSVTVTWTTSEPATSYVSYGEFSGDLKTRVGNNTLTTDHKVTITGLQPGSTWYFQAESGWPGAPATTSAEGSFTTPTYNLITSESFTATQTSATLGFTTLEAASATVKYGTAVNALNSTATVSGGGTSSLSAAFNGLTAGTTYYYTISLNGASMGGTSEMLGTFTTPAAGGTAKTVTHDTVAKIKDAVARNLQLGGAGSLLRLERQGVPGVPVEGPELPIGNYYSGVTIGNGFMYVVGGAGPDAAAVNTVYYIPMNADGTLDGTTGWRTTTPLPEVRIMVNDQVFTYNGRIYVIGGSANSATHLPTVLYATINADGTLGAWQNGPSLPAPTSFGSAFPLNGHVVVSGGFDVDARNTNYIAEIRPDGSLGPWQMSSSLDAKRDFHRTVTDGARVYAVSNFAAATMAAGATSPTGELGQFTGISPDLPSVQYAMAAGLVKGKIVAAAGRTTGNGPLTPANINYIKVQQDGLLDFGWNTSANLYPVGSLDLDAEAYNGKLYAAGGRTAFSSTAPNPTPKVVIIPMEDDPADPTYAFVGTLESGVIDLGGVGSLQRLTVSGTGLTSSNVEVRYRFAATANGTPNPVFSDWFTTSGADAAISGGARYVQYQVILKSDGTATPTVTGVALTANVTAVTLPGDVDKNGTPNERNDVIMALKIAGGLLSSTDPTVSYEGANVAGNANVDILDAATIARRSNGL